jgi:DNA-binding CsgD family transcriptional regulator
MAEWYIQQCDGCEDDLISIVYYAQAMMYKFKDDYLNAYLTSDKMQVAQDKVVLNSLNNPILDKEIQFLKKDMEQADKENRLNRTRNILIICGIMLILIIITILIYIRIKQYRKEIASYISTLSELELMRNDTNHTSQYNLAIAQLYQDRMEQINKLCEVYYSHSSSSRQALKVYQHVHSMVDDLTNDTICLSQLEKMVNSAMNNVMQNVRTQCPSLSERELRIVLYTCAGFSNVAICLFIGCRSETLPKIKYKIRERIKQSNSPNLEQLVGLLYNNKH